MLELFSVVDLRIHSNQLRILRNLQIRKHCNFEYNGSSIEELHTRIYDFLVTEARLSDEEAIAVAVIVCNTNAFLWEKFNTNTSWVTMRLSLPHSHYDIPRWHADGEYFKSTERLHKLVGTLVGAKTRFALAIDNGKFDALQAQYDLTGDSNILIQMADLVKEIFPTVDESQAVIFFAGENGTIHAEPPVHDPRLFFSIVTGQEEEISSMQT